MRRALVLALCLAMVVPATVATAQSGGGRAAPVDVYEVEVGGSQQQAELREDGFDIVDAEVDKTGDKTTVTLAVVATPAEAERLRRKGVTVALRLDTDGMSVGNLASLELETGFDVWRPFSGEGGIREEIEQLADDYSDIAELETIGQSTNGLPIYAVKVTSTTARAGRSATSRRCCTRTSSTPASGSPPSRGAAGCATCSRTTGPTSRSPGSSRNASCGSSRSPTPTGTTGPSPRATGCGARTCATTTAMARSPPTTVSTSTATSRPTGATTTKGSSPGLLSPRRLPRDEAGVGAGDPGDGRAARSAIDFSVFARSTTHSAAELILYGVGWQVDDTDTRRPGQHRRDRRCTDANPAIARL